MDVGGLFSDFAGPDAVEAVGADGTPSARRGSDTCTQRRFGHGTVKMVRQAQSREKLLQKKLEEGLTEKPQRDAEWDFTFPDPGAEPAWYLNLTPSTRVVSIRRGRGWFFF